MLATALYVGRGLAQFATLSHQDLTYDFGQFWNAARDLNAGRDPYLSFLSSCPVHWCTTGYVYPTLLAQALRPLALLPIHTAGAIWLGLMQACVVASIVLVGRLVAGWLSRTALAMLLTAAMLFFPLYQALYFLQVLPLVLLLLTVAAVAYTRERDARTGFVLAVGAALRVSPGLMAPALLERRGQLRRPAGLVAMAVAFAALVAFMLALGGHALDYVTRVAPRVAASSAELDNQSPAGFLLRVHALAPGWLPLPATVVAGVVAVVVIAATWWGGRGEAGARRRALVFAAFLAATPLATTITEPYHYTTELLVFALAAASLRPRGPAWWLAVLSYPLLWADGHVTNPLAIALGLEAPTGWRVAPFLLVTSINLVGTALLWLACVMALRSTREAVSEGATAAPETSPHRL